jgi:hypothetical protein
MTDERPIAERLADSAALDASARAHFAARRAGDQTPPPITLHRSRSGRLHDAGCLALTHDGPCDCPTEEERVEARARELVAALRPGAQWHGKGGAARQRLRILATDLDANPARVSFERIAGVPADVMGRPVWCGLDQLLAAFVPDPRGTPYGHLTDLEYSVVERLSTGEGADPDAYIAAFAEELEGFIGRLGGRLRELAPVEGLERADYCRIAAACVADDWRDAMAVVAPEVELWP